ncbi:MAG: redoxin family protein [Methylophagaceae bacterium]
MRQVPNVTFKLRTRNEESGEFDWSHPTTDDYFKNKRVVVFSLPGAFTPTCSNNQVPGFDVLYDQIVAEGVDEVYCVSCNDAFVMNAWAEDLRIKNVKLIPDGSCEFTNGMGMLVAKDNLGFGQRSWRYAMVVDDGVVERMFVEPGQEDDCGTDPYGESAPEKVLEYLKS